MSGDTWGDIQALKSKRSNLREKLARRKHERQQLLSAGSAAANALAPPPIPDADPVTLAVSATSQDEPVVAAVIPSVTSAAVVTKLPIDSDAIVTPELLMLIEKKILLELSNITLELPIEVTQLYQIICKSALKDVPITKIEDLIQKFAAQMLIVVSSKGSTHAKESKLVVESVDHTKLTAVCDGLDVGNEEVRKRKRESEDANQEDENSPHSKQSKKEGGEDVIENLLKMQSAKQRENTKVTEEILELLSAPTAKEQSLVEKFKSVGGAQVQEFCNHGTREECAKVFDDGTACDKLHFKKIIHKHTDETLGDCSFLNTCFHMDTCKYVHYEIDYPEKNSQSSKQAPLLKKIDDAQSTILYPPQWIQSDLRYFDMSVLGKFAVVMADPPWDIHMELPYGTMSDDEMRKLNIPVLQDDGYIFLWVTGRAMELGRECLKIWGYERVDEMIWVKTNQLQRIIRTGRTGHWLNHGKEHCLVGAKGNPQNVNRGLDCDVIVAEVRATSHKPDEIYGIIERLAPGSRKIELFGRPHNIQPNWITLGNQTDGVKLLDPDVVKAFRKRYPDGNCLKPPTNP